MSIRQIRLQSTETIKTRIAEFKGKYIQIVLENKTAMFGVLKVIDEHGIVVENRRLKKNHFLFRDIAEIYYDQIV